MHIYRTGIVKILSQVSLSAPYTERIFYEKMAYKCQILLIQYHMEIKFHIYIILSLFQHMKAYVSICHICFSIRKEFNTYIWGFLETPNMLWISYHIVFMTLLTIPEKAFVCELSILFDWILKDWREHTCRKRDVFTGDDQITKSKSRLPKNPKNRDYQRIELTRLPNKILVWGNTMQFYVFKRSFSFNGIYKQI